jgi:hypothetical protein
MNETAAYRQAVAVLREALGTLEARPDTKLIQESRDEVLKRFQPVFSCDHVREISEQDLRAFLLFENNRHWSGLHRHSNRICADMQLLRDTLARLLDEDEPIEERFDHAVTTVPGMGKAVVTAILLVAHPDKYGAWNSTAEAGLKAADLWPRFERGESMGKRYVKINDILNKLAQDIDVDLWTLDTLWWAVAAGAAVPEGQTEEGAISPGAGEAQAFGLERHLQEFMRDNWDRMPLGKEWGLYTEPGDPEAGYEYPCGVGRIDLLAKHRTKPEWLIVELKRGQTSDSTVGQVLRYIGWIRKHLAEPGETVRGLVIAREADPGLMYALETVPDVDLQLYEVDFRLTQASHTRGSC